MIDSNKWSQLEQILKVIDKWNYSRQMFEKVIIFLTRLILICPYFLLNQLFEAFKFFILVCRKKF